MKHSDTFDAVRKASKWGGKWATLRSPDGNVYTVEVTLPLREDVRRQLAAQRPRHTLLCLANSASIAHLDVEYFGQ